MKLTPGQLRDVLGLPQETFRHWKKVLPPLVGRNGYAPCFSPGDLLAMKVVQVMADNFGLRIGVLTGVAAHLFDICNRLSWASLEETALILDPANGTVVVATGKTLNLTTPVLVIPCGPLILQLRARLLAEQRQEAQTHLMFPPTGLMLTASYERGRKGAP